MYKLRSFGVFDYCFTIVPVCALFYHSGINETYSNLIGTCNPLDLRKIRGLPVQEEAKH